MANRTAKDVQTVKGTNPQFLIEKIIRLRVYDCTYWKEDCFALTGTFQDKYKCMYPSNFVHFMNQSALYSVWTLI